MVNKILTQEEIEKFPHSFYSHAEAILHLSEVGIDVKQTRVADWLDVSRANVSQVIGRMQNSGLVEFKEDLELTTKGLYLSQIISRRHRITERFLSEVLNLSWDKVYKETRKWENVLSPTTEKAMLEILGNPITCPFGNPIPHSDYNPINMMNLLEVRIDTKYSIEKITEELKKDSKMIQFLQKQEIMPGTEINVLDSNKYSITVSTNNNKYFGLDQFIAERVYVS